MIFNQYKPLSINDRIRNLKPKDPPLIRGGSQMIVDSSRFGVLPPAGFKELGRTSSASPITVSSLANKLK